MKPKPNEFDMQLKILEDAKQKLNPKFKKTSPIMRALLDDATLKMVILKAQENLNRNKKKPKNVWI